MDALRCPPDDADVTKLSGGEQRRVALCRLLLEKPDLLLLDEPTNHLDAECVAWLEGHLRNYPGTVLIVTHDRYFLDNVTSWILELDRGRGIPYRGQLFLLARAEAEAAGAGGREEEARQQTLAARAGMDRARARAPARPRPRRASSATRSCWPRPRRRRRRPRRSSSRPAERLGRTWSSRPSICARASATTC